MENQAAVVFCHADLTGNKIGTGRDLSGRIVSLHLPGPSALAMAFRALGTPPFSIASRYHLVLSGLAFCPVANY